MTFVKKSNKGKKGISPMISYVLLISFAIALGFGVYQWMKSYIPSEELSLECPEGVSIGITDIVCENSQLNLTFKNRGRFDIDGYFIHATNDSSQELATIDLSELLIRGGEKVSGAVKFPGTVSLSPNNEIRNTFNLSFPIYSVEIIPIRFEEINNKKRLVSCKDSKVREKVSCSGTSGTGTGSTILPQGLVSWWRFEGNADDENGINDGTIFGANCNSAGRFDLACNFNGVGDYVDISDDNSLDINGNITIVAWVKREGNGQDSLNGEYILNKGANEYTLLFSNTGSILQYFTGSNPALTSVNLGDTSNWHHWAVTFNPFTDVSTFYKDGSLLESVSQTGTPLTSTGSLSIGHYEGASINRGFNGTIDEVMIFDRALTIGEISSLYNMNLSNAIANNSCLPGTCASLGQTCGTWSDGCGGILDCGLPCIGGGNDANAVLLLHMNGADGSTIFTDSSASPHTITANGNSQISTAQNKFGGSSGYFDGTGDYLVIPDSSDFDFGTDDFTIDAWIKAPASAKTNYRIIYAKSQAISSGWWLAGTLTGAIVASHGGATYIIGTIDVFDDNWHHIAYLRNSGNTYLYVDGSLDGTSSSESGDYDNALDATIGMLNDGFTYPWLGYMDELRVSKGIARWTSDFTPPTQEYSGGPIMLGADSSNPGLSCKDIFNNGSSTGDSSYWIDPLQIGSPFQVYCDMTNGGWTLVLRGTGGNIQAGWGTGDSVNLGSNDYYQFDGTTFKFNDTIINSIRNSGEGKYKIFGRTPSYPSPAPVVLWPVNYITTRYASTSCNYQHIKTGFDSTCATTWADEALTTGAWSDGYSWNYINGGIGQTWPSSCNYQAFGIATSKGNWFVSSGECRQNTQYRCTGDYTECDIKMFVN